MNSKLLILTLLVPFSVAAEHWPAWRGSTGTGISAEKNVPVEWSAEKNVRWRAELPGPGNSSPIVWGDKVFVSQFIKAENRRTLMCFDRATGKMLWQSGVTYNEKEPTQQNNPYCAGTPATDGERVYVSYGSAGVYAYDFNGKEVWHRDLGKLNHVFGTAVSPILYGDLCIMNHGPDEKARLVALDKRTGQIIWEAEPPKVDPSEQQTRGGFGGGNFLAPQTVTQADKNQDQKLTQEEFTALAESWYDRFDQEKAGKLSQDKFAEKLSEVFPPQGGPGPGGRGDNPNPPSDGQRPGGGGGRFNPARMVGPGIFTAGDVDKDGALTRNELKGLFSTWFSQWDANKLGAIREDDIRAGLNAALPSPGGPGGPAGRGPGGGRGGFNPGAGASWSTPVIVKVGGRNELVVGFPYRLAAYDPKTGKELWISKGVGGTIYTTPLTAQGMVIGMSSGMSGASAVAVKAGGSGDVTDGQRVWRSERIKGRTGSGVVHEGHLYTVSDNGIAECTELATGKILWEERLKGPGAKTSSWSSLVLADGKIYAPNQSGDIFVFRASPKFELIATNSVDEPTNASLAISEGQIFIRTDKNLWCVAGNK